MRDTVALKEEVIDKLYAQYVDCPKRDAWTLTNTSEMAQTEILKHELHGLGAHAADLEDQVHQLKSAMRR